MSQLNPETSVYRDHASPNSSLSVPRSMASSHPDLEDYYEDGRIPPPHRLSTLYQSSQGAYDFVPDRDSTERMHDAPRHYYGEMEAPGRSPWMQHEKRRGFFTKRWIIIAAIALAGLIIIGVVLGVVLSKRNTSAAASSSPSSPSNSSGVPTQTDPNDPSTFVKNSALHQSFYGLAYTPSGSQLPQCGNNLSEVIQDIQLISQLTKRIRLYGSDCNQTALVLEAIRQTKVDMTVWVGIYNLPTDQDAAYIRQRDILKSTLQTYGVDHVSGVTVGNEYMLNYITANSGTADQVNGALGNQGAALLIANIQDARQMVSSLNLPKTLPVGNADAGSYFNTQVLQAVDYGLSNVHAWFAEQSINTAANWTTSFFQETNVAPAAALSNKPMMYIAETGWPTKSSDTKSANNGVSEASVPNLQIFLDTFVCSSNTNNIPYFYFETFDEPWKDAQFGGVEGWWGMFNSDRTLKSGITIPNCSSR